MNYEERQSDYYEKNPTWHEEDSPWKAQQVLRMIKKNNLPVEKICEVGCGAGEILNQLHKQLTTTEFEGYEVSPDAFTIAKPKEKERLSFYLQDFIAAGKDGYDILLAIDLIEHLEAKFTFLRNFKYKGTYKIFHFPLDLSAQSVLRNSPLNHKREKVGHVHYYTKDLALVTLRETGYEILDWYYTGSSIDLTSASLPSKVAKIPRKLLFKLFPDFTVRLLGGYSLLVLAR